MYNARGLENASTFVLNLVIETTCIYLVSSTNVTLFPVDVISHKRKSPKLLDQNVSSVTLELN